MKTDVRQPYCGHFTRGIDGFHCNSSHEVISETEAIDRLLRRVNKLEQDSLKMSMALFDLGFYACANCGNYHKQSSGILTAQSNFYCMACWATFGLGDECDEELDSDAWENEQDWEAQVIAVWRAVVRHGRLAKIDKRIRDRYAVLEQDQWGHDVYRWKPEYRAVIKRHIERYC